MIITQEENTGRICQRIKARGGALCEGDDEAGDLGGLLGHHADLVPVGAAGQRLDDGPHDGLQHSLLDGVVRLLIGPGGSSGDGEEELEADQGNVSPGEGILAVEVDALDPVGLAGSGLAGDDVDEGGDELDCELQHGGEEAAVLLGLEAQLAVLSLDAVAEVSAGRGPELAGKLLRGVTPLWQAVALDEAG